MFLQAMVWSISYVAVAPLRLVVVRLTGLFRTLNVPLHFLICVLRGSPQHYFVLRPTRLFSAYIAVTYGALSSTAMFVTYGALSSTCLFCDLRDSSRRYLCALALPYLCLTGLSPALFCSTTYETLLGVYCCDLWSSLQHCYVCDLRSSLQHLFVLRPTRLFSALSLCLCLMELSPAQMLVLQGYKT